jgi:hypothetical protein
MLKGRCVIIGGRTRLLDLPGHLDNARSAAGGGGGVEADEGAGGASCDAGKHVWCLGFDVLGR